VYDVYDYREGIVHLPACFIFGTTEHISVTYGVGEFVLKFSLRVKYWFTSLQCKPQFYVKVKTKTNARVVNETDTLRKTSRMLIWGSHRPLHGVANVKSLVAIDETGFKVLTLKHLLECSKVNRQPIGKPEMKFKE
jgi:hypothetical protein